MEVDKEEEVGQNDWDPDSQPSPTNYELPGEEFRGRPLDIKQSRTGNSANLLGHWGLEML